MNPTSFLETEPNDFIETVKEIAAAQALRAAETDSTGTFPVEAVDSLASQGLMGLCLPAEFGGFGQSPGVFVRVVEHLAQACSSTSMIYVMHVAASQVIATSNTLSDREQILTDMCRGKHLTTLAFSERGSRSQFWAPVSKLVRSDDGFTTDASKSWVTSAHHADSYVSSALRPDAQSPLESTLYLARPSSPQIEVQGRFEGLGLRGNDSAPAEYKGLHVRNGDLLTENGTGADAMLKVVLPWFAIGTSAMANGLCMAAVATTSNHMKRSKFEQDQSRLRDLPNLRSRLSEMSCRTDQSRALLDRATEQMLDPGDKTMPLILQSRLAAMQAAVDVTDLAMKTCGGAAFSKHLGIERLFRDARAGWVMAPTVDHLQNFLGRVLTGLPMF